MPYAAPQNTSILAETEENTERNMHGIPSDIRAFADIRLHMFGACPGTTY